jgi:TolB-like protein
VTEWRTGWFSAIPGSPVSIRRSDLPSFQVVDAQRRTIRELAARAAWSPRAGAYSMSVLPLRAIGGSQLQQAADAVTEEMTTGLAATPGITLRSATRAQAMLREGADVDQVGRRLGVAFIADGSVQGSATRLRLTVRLLRANDAVAVWANTFDFPAEDLPAVARSVADSVAAAVMRSGV